jgi:hypothetical protein
MKVSLQLYLFASSCLTLAVHAMISKRASYLEKLQDVPREQRFRANVADMFLQNDISATRIRQLIEDQKHADKNAADDLLAAGSSGKHGNNVSRDLLRKLSKKSAWPTLYWAKIRVFDLKMQVVRKVKFPFLLPHELVWCLSEHSRDETALFQHGGLCKQSADHLANCAQLMGISLHELVAVNFWGDGVPMNFDRTQSLEVFSMAFPGLAAEHHNLRFPITVIPKKYVAKQKTKDDILKIISWSMEHLAAGMFPVQRHDAEPWQHSDTWRKRKSNQPLPRGILVEVKGDWAFMKDCFRFPQHNEKQGCCWLCHVCPDGIRDASSQAPWRTNRLSHWELLHRIRSGGNEVSPLFSVPFLSSKQFLIDWLHVADQGISAVFLACLFKFVLPKLPGQSMDDKCSHLYGLMLEFYEEHQVEAVLDNLTKNMLGKQGKCPKLRGRAAEIRALIPFSVKLAALVLKPDDLIEQGIILAAKALNECYNNLHKDVYSKSDMAKACKTFCILMCELETRTQVFRVIPKQHLFQELCEMSDINPSKTWCYRDEDFGGSLASISRVRGGSNRAANIAKSVLLKFKAQHKLPRL